MRRPSEAQKKRRLADLETQIIMTLDAAMQNAEKLSEKVSAANAAIKYLAVTSKIPGEYGAGLED